MGVDGSRRRWSSGRPASRRRRLSRSSMVWKSTTADRSWSGLRYKARRTTACSLSAIAQALRAWTEGLFQRLPKWLDNRPSSLHAVSSDISGKTGRLPNSISTTWGASCRWPTTLPTEHSAPTAFSAEDSLGGTLLILRTQRSIGCTRWISMVPSGAVSLGSPTTCIAPYARVFTSANFHLAVLWQGRRRLGRLRQPHHHQYGDGRI